MFSRSKLVKEFLYSIFMPFFEECEELTWPILLIKGFQKWFVIATIAKEVIHSAGFLANSLAARVPNGPCNVRDYRGKS